MTTTTLKTFAALLSFLFLAACGSDEMAPPKPCAMWPVTITAGVNDKIDVSIWPESIPEWPSGLPAETATIAAGTYYSPTEMAAAVRTALVGAFAGKVIIPNETGLGRGKKFDIKPAVGVVQNARMDAGIYTPAEFLTWLNAHVPLSGRSVTIGADGKITIAAGSAWRPYDESWDEPPFTHGWELLGFGLFHYPADPFTDALSHTGSAPLKTDTGEAWAVSVSDAGHIVIGLPGASFSLLFSTGANAATSARNILGFGAVDTTPGTSTTAAHQMEGCWFGDDPVAFDSYDRPVSIRRAQTRALSGKVRTRTFATQYERTIDLAFLPPHKVFASEEGASHLNEALERMFVSGASRLRWFPDATDLATYADYALEAGTKFDPRRLSAGADLYSQSLRLLRYV